MRHVVETAFYDGRFKHWRILNLTTGSAYGTEFETEQAALDSIEHGQQRNGATVWRVKLAEILQNTPAAQSVQPQNFNVCVACGHVFREPKPDDTKAEKEYRVSYTSSHHPGEVFYGSVMAKDADHAVWLLGLDRSGVALVEEWRGTWVPLEHALKALPSVE